jgi:enoyl-CoA hydratase/carnithine racemase
MNAPVAATEDLIYSVEDGIARLTFNRPQARNALTFAMYERMAAICEDVNKDRSIKVMILTGTGDKAFASGTDISQFGLSRPRKTRSNMKSGSIAYWGPWRRSGCRRLRRSPVPAPAAARESPPAAISGSVRRRRG